MLPQIFGQDSGQVMPGAQGGQALQARRIQPDGIGHQVLRKPRRQAHRVASIGGRHGISAFRIIAEVFLEQLLAAEPLPCYLAVSFAETLVKGKRLRPRRQCHCQ